MFTLTVFEILVVEGMSVLSPAQQGAGSERVSMKNQITIRLFLKLVEK